MSEMIDRVAMALAGPDFVLGPDHDEFREETVSSILRRLARRAIDAMREPTEAMVEDGYLMFSSEETPADCWKAMIDAALKAQNAS